MSDWHNCEQVLLWGDYVPSIQKFQRCKKKSDVSAVEIELSYNNRPGGEFGVLYFVRICRMMHKHSSILMGCLAALHYEVLFRLL